MSTPAPRPTPFTKMTSLFRRNNEAMDQVRQQHEQIAAAARQGQPFPSFGQPAPIVRRKSSLFPPKKPTDDIALMDNAADAIMIDRLPSLSDIAKTLDLGINLRIPLVLYVF